MNLGLVEFFVLHSEDVSAKGAVLLLLFECLFVGISLLLCEGSHSGVGVRKFLAIGDLLVSRFARVWVANSTRVLCAVADSEIGVGMPTHLSAEPID